MKTQSALINPVTLPPGESWTPAENKFVKCMNADEPCIIGESRPTAAIREGENANVIRGEMIRYFVLSGDNSASQGGEKSMSLTGAWIDGGLNLAFADIRTSMTFDKCHFGKKINLFRTNLLSLYMNGCRLSEGLDGRQAQVHGDLAVRHKSSTKGKVDLSAAIIDGELDFNKSIFVGLGSDSGLIIGGAHVRKNLSLKNGRFCGAVYLNNTRVDESLNCSHARVQHGMFASLMEIKKSIFLSRVQGTGDINLVFSKAGVLIDYMPDKRIKFQLNGFTYNQFGTPGSFQSRINWLKNRLDTTRFSPQPFEQAARALFAAGQDIDAREILLEKEKLLTEHGNISGALKFCRRWWDRFAGYGYQLWKTLAWSVGIIIAGAVIFDFADDACHIVPSQPAVVVSEKYMNAQTHKCTIEGEPTKATVRLFPEYSKFQPLAYSMDVFFPFFALHQEPYWEPKHGGETNEVVLYALRFLFWLEVALGWLLTSLAVLSITGLLRPRQSSGDKE